MKDYSKMTTYELEQLRDEISARLDDDNDQSMDEYMADCEELEMVEDALEEAYDHEWNEEEDE